MLNLVKKDHEDVCQVPAHIPNSEKNRNVLLIIQKSPD